MPLSDNDAHGPIGLLQWLRESFGITKVSEYQSPKLYLFTQTQGGTEEGRLWLEQFGARQVFDPVQEVQALGIPLERYESFNQTVFDFYRSDNKSTPARMPADYPAWREAFMRRELGIIDNSFPYYRAPSGFFLHFESESKRSDFFADVLFGQMKQDPLTGSLCVLLTSQEFLQLRQSYMSIKPPHGSLSSREELAERIQFLETVLQQFEKGEIVESFNMAWNLALGYDNADLPSRRSYLLGTEGVLAYHLSLKLFAMLHREELSGEEYQQFLSIAELLCIRDKHGNNIQSLAVDSQLRVSLIDLYDAKDQHQHRAHEEYGAQVASVIDDNVRGLLCGDLPVALGEGRFYVHKRFLPDEDGNSATDELLLQGGSSRNHSSLFRLYKEAVYAEEDTFKEVPLYYRYFKEEYNAGTFAHNDQGKLCDAVFRTEIIPCDFSGDLPKVVELDPLAAPKLYQAAMTKTLCELLRADRNLMLYPTPNAQVHPCLDAWKRNRYIQCYISRYPYYDGFEVPREDLKGACHDNIQSPPSAAFKGYSQISGDCIIASQSQFIRTRLGEGLFALHKSYMQYKPVNAQLEQVAIFLERLRTRYESLVGQPVKKNRP